ncbi:MAG: hypothetical protein NXI31_06770 [bacterium]|nr:hypothetical protein [bacterium]
MKLSQLDLYTGLILLCVILLPVCGWWCYQTNEEIKQCEKARRDATRSNGLLEKIGALQKKVEVVNNSNATLTRTPRQFFETQILVAAANGGLSANDFGLVGPKEEPLTIPGSRQKAVDHVMAVDWKRKDLPLKLELIQALLWNCESGAGMDPTKQMQSVWRLRTLDITNISDGKSRTFASFKTPPPELEDRWSITKMEFARREPRKN